ncbi:dTDP-glucose 4,6-dehydratase [Saccharothrix syringae]|uniref:NAD-dependent epimerase/dehydratase family protein n=1 Tax=Saccharothrix syringae TaxID=103733 RepID=A0A5Q0GUR0_SACSY|nr:NAD-dependent epimerase/dehydratase family protein [Saccharothrix syringae]QFZ17738.1 NAD-dependent epimerase/dehydratase family protein [Saccharothrix syringae]
MAESTVLVVGGAGFIGTNLVRYWLDEHPRDRVISLTSPRHRKHAHDSAVNVECELDNPVRIREVLSEHDVDTVINCGGWSDNARAVRDPLGCFRANVADCVNVLEACRTSGVRRYHQVSSAEVYGDIDDRATADVDESAAQRPFTPYSSTKAAADHLALAYGRTYRFDVTITLSSNNYGPAQLPEKLIPRFVIRALLGQQLPIFDSPGSSREWLHVKDHCRAIDHILAHGTPGQRYNVGSGESADAHQIADLILDYLGLPTALKTLVPSRPVLLRRTGVDSGKLRTEVGWRPEKHFATALKETIEWYVDNRTWWLPHVDLVGAR